MFDRDVLFQILGGGLVIGLGAGALIAEAGGPLWSIPACMGLGLLVALGAVRE